MAKKRTLSLGAVMVLHSVARGCMYGFDIMEETGLTSGTIYPALDKLEALGLANSEWEEGKIAQQEKRPPRRYYQISERGEEVLLAAMNRYRSLAPVEFRSGIQARPL